MKKSRRLLVVVRWPLGGIRTYMRYVYRHFYPEFKVTILAAQVQEFDALRQDADLINAELILAPQSEIGFLLSVMRTLPQQRYDIVQSHGFISAVSTCLANFFYKKPHVLTVHGILEDRLLSGFKGKIKRFVANWAICSVDVLYAVSEDILSHVRKQVPRLQSSNVRQVVILNGIEPEIFLQQKESGVFRTKHGLSQNIFLFGFLGRFMPQKGFDKLIEALALMEAQNLSCDYLLVAMGSGDYRSEYEHLVHEKGLSKRVVFLPFQSNVNEVFRDLNAVVMPSRWEAFGLLAAEALVSGVPIIASDCIGLREILRDTPARVIPSGNPSDLAGAMVNALDGNWCLEFNSFKEIAANRFDVTQTSKKLKKLLSSLL